MPHPTPTAGKLFPYRMIGAKVSEEECAALESRARGRKLTLSEWVRAELLEAKAGSDGLARRSTSLMH